MSLLTTGKGKKGLIEMLLKEGKSDDEIVEQLGTTKSYVQKVKSQSKSTKGKIGASDIKQDEVEDKRVLEINKEIINLPEHESLYTSEEKRSLTKNELRKIYNLFFKGKTPSKIVAKTGYQYEVVDAEYRNYNKDTGLDMQRFQEEFISVNSEDIEDVGSKGEAFLKRYKRDGYLLNEDFSELIQLIRDDDKESGIYDVLNGEVSPPEGWTRIPCDVCGKTLGDALVDARESWADSL